MVGFLRITDGTTIINIVPDNDKGGYNLLEWTPSAPEELEIWNNAPYSDGRRLAIKKYGNALSSFLLHITGDTADNVINQAQDLRRLLQKGVEYWSTSWQNSPVWLEARGNCETNTRYAYVLNFSAPHDDDPYIAPTGTSPSAFEAFDLIIEHSKWMDGLPGTCLSVDNIEPYGLLVRGLSYPAQSTDDVYVTNGAAFNSAGIILEFGENAGVEYSSAIRFTNVAIPQGALVHSAIIRLEQHTVFGATTNCNIRIRGEDADNAVTFVNYANWLARVRTTAYVDQSISIAWVNNTFYNLVDISSIIQEIVNRPGWVSGNNLVIFIDNNGSDAGAIREPCSWDGDPTMPELIYEYSDTDMGRDSTCLREVFFANKHNDAQLTHIFQEDNVGGFSANLILDPVTVPYILLNADQDWMVYFGVDTAPINGGGPFDNLIFDLAAGVAGNATGQWEYWDGAAWSVLTTEDDSAGMNTLGVSGVYWEQPSDWVTRAVNGVTAWWVRFYITACPGAAPSVMQQNRQVYTVVTPYINVEAEDVTGDISALARLKLYYESQLLHVPPTAKTLVGLRSLSRGDDFSPYINLSEVQNRVGITVVSADGVDVSIATDMNSATGLSAFWNSTTATYLISTITIDESVASQYSGTFRAFIRCRQRGNNAGEAAAWIEGYANAQQFFTTPMVPTYTVDNTVSGLDHIMILDMGNISIPFDPQDKLGEITIYVYAQADNASQDFYFYELILMPADEWIAEYSAVSDLGLQSLDNTQVLDIDPLSMPKLYNPANSRHATGASLDYQIARYKGKGISPPILQEHADQRYWFLSQGMWDDVAPYTGDCNVYLGNMEITHSFMGIKALRYFTSRGTR